MYELKPQYARVMSFAGDHPLFAHVRAQKRCGAILRQSFSFRSDRVRVCHATSHLCTLPNFASLIEYKNPVDSLILGVGGIPPRPSRSKAPPPCSSEQSNTKKFSFPFRRKNRARANQEMRRKLFCGTASEASGGGAERQFRSKKFRAKFRISHQLLQKRN